MSMMDSIMIIKIWRLVVKLGSHNSLRVLLVRLANIRVDLEIELLCCNSRETVNWMSHHHREALMETPQEMQSEILWSVAL